MNKQLIELIINALSNGAEMHAYDLYELCERDGYKRGTYTSYISMMKKAGYLRRVKPRVYAIGKMASTTTIDHNLRRLSLHKKHFAPTPEQKKALKMEPLPAEPFVSKSTQIIDAIGVLKSYGIKVTLEF